MMRRFSSYPSQLLRYRLNIKKKKIGKIKIIVSKNPVALHMVYNM